jgi:chaperonin GroEL
VPALDALEVTGDEAVGVKALAHALGEPMRVIVANAGLEVAPSLARARCDRRVYDVLRQAWVDPWSGGILDPLAVVLTALEASVSAVMTALTADVLIRRAKPPRVVDP